MTALEKVTAGIMFVLVGWMFSRAAVDHWLPYSVGLFFLISGLIIIFRVLDRWLNG